MIFSFTPGKHPHRLWPDKAQVREPGMAHPQQFEEHPYSYFLCSLTFSVKDQSGLHAVDITEEATRCSFYDIFIPCKVLFPLLILLMQQEMLAI